MNYNETKDILTILKTNYPQSFKGWTYDQSQAFLNLWAEAFKDEPVGLVAGAVKSIIYGDTREFAPNIGQVKAKIYSLTHEADMTEIEAWQLVKNALRNSGYNAADEFEKLPVVVQRLVGSPRQLYEWSMMDSEKVDTVVASNFQRSYKVRAKHEREMLSIPADVKKALGIEEISERMKIESKPTKQVNMIGYDNSHEIERAKAEMIALGHITPDEMIDILDFVKEYSVHYSFNQKDVLMSLRDELKQGSTKEDIFNAMKIHRKKIRE